MKKLCFLALILVLFLATVSAAGAAAMPGQQNISHITDENGYVTSLTDDNATTAWTKQSAYGPDLTLYTNYASVGEIWIRNGYAYTQNWYTHYDRAAKVKVTVYYYANQYTESFDTYRYNLTDAFRPNTVNKSWSNGYQRLLLPKQYRNVTRIELTIEGTVIGAGRTGATISDIIVASGSHATATPKSHATATPKPYVVYVTPTPAPATPVPDYSGTPDDNRGDNDYPYVELITPVGPATNTPAISVVTPTVPPVEMFTPVPPSTVKYPSSGGVIGYTTMRIATRFGPNGSYGEPGSFFTAGQEVKVITRVWDPVNDLYWYQLEFMLNGQWLRAYVTDSRVNVVDTALIPKEVPLGEPLDIRTSLIEYPVYYGPGENYKCIGTLGADKRCPIYNIENGWVQVEYINYANDVKYRGWVPMHVVYGE